MDVGASGGAAGAAAAGGMQGGGAAAAAAAGRSLLVGSASGESPYQPLSALRAYLLKGRFDDYEILGSISRETALEIAAGTGLQIRVPAGRQSIGVVTTWGEEAKDGELCFGAGASGVFCLGKATYDARFVGLKFSEKGRGRKEWEILRQLRGVKGILPAVEFIEGAERDCQVVEVGGLGSVATIGRLAREGSDSELREQLYYQIAKGLLTALSSLHDENCFHQDVHPGNLVINHLGKVLLIDFDRAVIEEDGQIELGETGGHRSFWAPERFIADARGYARGYNSAAGDKLDAWGAGMLLLQIVTGFELNYREVEGLLAGSQEMESTLERYLKTHLEIPDTPLGKLIESLLRFDPGERLSPKAALSDPWFGALARQVRAGSSLQRLRGMVSDSVMQSDAGQGLSPHECPTLYAGHVHRKEPQMAVIDRLMAGEGITVIHGSPGMGKTHLATFSANHQEIRRRFGKILWFRSAGEVDQLEGQLISLSAELGLSSTDASISEVEALVFAHLNTLERPVLMVFDDAGDRTGIERLLQLTNGHTVVTSSHKSWLGEDVEREIVPIGPLSLREGSLLVEAQLDREGVSAEQLCSELGYVPESLVSACAYMRQHGIECDQFVEQVSSGRLSASSAAAGGTDQAITKMHRLVLKQLDGTPALTLLRRLCVLSPHGIPRTLLLACGDEESVQQLVDYGFLRATSPHLYSLTPVAAQVTRSTLSEEALQGVLRESSRALFGLWQPTASSIREVLMARLLLSHAEELLNSIEADSPLTDQIFKPRSWHSRPTAV